MEKWKEENVLPVEEASIDERIETSLIKLQPDDRKRMADIFAGKEVPPLYADVIAKRVFSPDVHPERLNFLLRKIAQDETIEVASSAANEGFHLSKASKTMISDLPAWLRDNRLADLEMQKVQQDFIFTRVELYAADMLLVQYSANADQKKSEVDYRNAGNVLLVVLMVESPEPFKEYDGESDRYIHRFTKMIADSGLSYKTKAKMIYVQLDKCLRQFKEGKNGEAADGKPDKLQGKVLKLIMRPLAPAARGPARGLKLLPRRCAIARRAI